jgi:hypothetical protein
MLSTLLNDHETMFFLWREGSVPRGQFEPWETTLRQLLAIPTVHSWWESTPAFTASFREFANDLVKNGSAA